MLSKSLVSNKKSRGAYEKPQDSDRLHKIFETLIESLESKTPNSKNPLDRRNVRRKDLLQTCKIEGPHYGSSLLYVLLKTLKVTDATFEEVIGWYGRQLKLKDFKVKAESGPNKDISGLWLAWSSALNGRPSALAFILNKFSKDLNLEDFKLEAGPGKDTSLLKGPMCSPLHSKPEAFKLFLEMIGGILNFEDFKVKSEVEPYKGKSELWLALLWASKGRPIALDFIFKRFGNNLSLEDFKVKIDAGPDKGASWLWFALRDASSGKPEVLRFILEKFSDNLSLEDFKVKAEAGPNKGKSGLWFALRDASNGKPEVLRFILEKFSDDLSLEDFKAEAGPNKGKSGLWFALRDASDCNSEVLKFILEKFSDDLSLEDFKAKVEAGPYKGASGLWLALRGAAYGNPEAFKLILEKFSDDLSLEDFKVKPEAGPRKGTSGLWLASVSASLGHCEVLNFIFDKFSDDLSLEDFKVKVEAGPYKGRSVLLDALGDASNSRPATLDLIKKRFGVALSLKSGAEEVSGGGFIADQESNKKADLKLAEKKAVAQNSLDFSNVKVLDCKKPASQNHDGSKNKLASCKYNVKIIGGIASKYLGVNPVPLAPVPVGSNVNGGILRRQTAINLKRVCDANASYKSSDGKKEYSYQVGLSKLKFYTNKTEIRSSDKVTFVFAGRKENALIPKSNPNGRTVIVFTSKEYKQLKNNIPRGLDVLVIGKDSLRSKSHGNFENPRLITSRRLAAFLFAHKIGLETCLVMDDNIESVHLSNEKAEFEWSAVFNKMESHLTNSCVCTSIGTISHDSKRHGKGVLGSKIFMYDMKRIKEKLKTPEELFTLLPPAGCADWWGEDYYTQVMLHQLFGRTDEFAYSILDEKVAGIKRSKKEINKANGVVKKATIWRDKDLLKYIKIDKLTSRQFEEDIKQVCSAFREVVKENINTHNASLKKAQTLDLIKSHAKANNVHFEAESIKPSKGLPSNGYRSSLEALKECAKYIKNIDNLYKHQRLAIQSIRKLGSTRARFDMCTASGKTRTQIAIAHLLYNAQPNKPIIIVSPNLSLVNQTYKSFETLKNKFKGKLDRAIPFHNVLKVSSETRDIGAQLLSLNLSLKNKNVVLVFCVKSYIKYLDYTKNNPSSKIEPALIMLDEWHKYNKSARKIAKSNPDVPILGFTATPVKENPFTDDIAFTYNRQDALKDKKVTPFILDELKQDYSKGMVKKFINNLPKFLESRYHPSGDKLKNRKGIIYLPSIEHVKNAKNILDANGIKCFAIHSKNKKRKEELTNFSKLGAKETGIVLAVKMLRVGFDDRNVSWTILAQKGENANCVSQVAGRVMRINDKEPKKIGYAISVFKSANTENFEFVCDKSALALADGKYLAQVEAISLYKEGLLKFICKNALTASGYKTIQSELKMERKGKLDTAFKGYKNKRFDFIAQFRLAELYANPDCSHYDCYKALQILKQLSDNNYRFAQQKLGHMYMKGRDGFLAQDKFKALKLFEKADTTSEYEALINKLDMRTLYKFSSKFHNERLNNIAVKLLKLSAGKGYHRAQFLYGQLLEMGLWGVAKNEASAIKNYKLSARHNNSDANNKLGELYKHGACGLEKDISKANEFFEASKRNNPKEVSSHIESPTNNKTSPRNENHKVLQRAPIMLFSHCVISISPRLMQNNMPKMDQACRPRRPS